MRGPVTVAAGQGDVRDVLGSLDTVKVTAGQTGGVGLTLHPARSAIAFERLSSEMRAGLA